MNVIRYRVLGVIIYGGDMQECVDLPREVREGDIFSANSRFFKVKLAGLEEQRYGGDKFTHFLVAENIGTWLECIKP